MPNIRRLARLLRSLFRRKDVETEIEAEMRLHVELETEELMREGDLSREEARRRALVAFGRVQQQKEVALDGSTLWWLDNLRRDVRIATRTLLRHPTFAITATLALALAIAVNTTMFTVLDAVINPRIGIREPDRLYSLQFWGDPKRIVDFHEREGALTASAHLFSDYTEWFPSFRGGVVERGARAENAAVARVRPNFFATLGMSAIEGTLVPTGDAENATASVVISSQLRAALFAPGESPIGATISVAGLPLTVIGVTTRYGAMEPLNHDVWKFGSADDLLPMKFVRLKAGVTRSDADRELARIAAQFAVAEGVPNADFRFQLSPPVRQFQMGRSLYALIGSGLAILLIACTNLANLQLARGLTRSAELAVRSSLGASRRQIVTQLLIESGVLSVAALALALVFSVAGNNILRATIPLNISQFIVQPRESWRMVVFAALAAVVCLAMIGLLPAIRTSRVDLNSLLKGRAGTGAHRVNHRIYGVFIVVQIALTLPLASAAVILSRTAAVTADLRFQMREYFGYDPTPLINVTIALPRAREPASVALSDVAAGFVNRARAVPGVVDAAISRQSTLPGSAVSVEDEDGDFRQLAVPMWSVNLVSDGYFRTFGLPITQGVDFSEGGTSAPVVIMDARSARYLWPRTSALGRTIHFAEARRLAPEARVVGLVGNHLSESAREFKEMMSYNRLGAVYELITDQDSVDLKVPQSRNPAIDAPFDNVTMIVRASGSPPDVAEALRRELRNVSSVPPMVTLQVDYLGITQQVTLARFTAGLFTTFGMLALGLSALGVYSIVAQSVADRRKEVAVRLSLGASTGNILRALIREGNVLVLAGIAIGLMLTKETIAWIGMLIPGSDLNNAVLFACMCGGLFVAMALAALIPALRATKLHPMDVLRAE